MRCLRCFCIVVGFGWGLAVAQTATVVDVPVPLLGPMMGNAVRTGDAVVGTDPAQADATRAAALKEDGLQRFARATYGGRTQVEALEFNDASGAKAAFTMYLKDGALGLKWDDAPDPQNRAVVDGRTIVLAQTVLLIAEKGADNATMMALVAASPKIGGPRSQPPLLPTFVPSRGLMPNSVRYALGPEGYAVVGGQLDVKTLGWEKSAEAVTAHYADRRGRESLTLLLYPTPQIAGEHARALEAQTAGNAKVRREGELVIVAEGTFSPDDTQNMIENIHLRSEVTFDKPLPPKFETEIRKTYSLLTSIAILSGMGALAAIVLGLSLGGGRALVRKMQGKDAATDAEFLSLHLDNQNPRAKLGPPGS